MEKDYMPALGGNLASRKKIISSAVSFRLVENLCEFRPKRIEIDFFLSSAPFFEGIGADGSKVGNCGKGEIQRHSRARARNCFLDVMRTVSPAWSWAKPMAASRLSQSFSASALAARRRASRITSLLLLYRPD